MAAIQTRVAGDVLVISFTVFKILDEASIQEIGSDMIAQVDKAPGNKILVNFDGVTFMSSAMIGKIILLNKKCKEVNTDLRLCAISPNVMEVFKLMRLDKVLKIEKDEASALKAFK